MGRVAPSRPRWYRSFYWRIGVSLVVLLVAVFAAQSVMFEYVLRRVGAPGNSSRNPNALAVTVAADLGAVLAHARDTDLNRYLAHTYGQRPQGIFVVMRDGRIAGNAVHALSDDDRRSALAALGGTEIGSSLTQGPVVTAPLQVEHELLGLVVLPPPPGPGGVFREMGRILSLPGILLLIVATTLATMFIFAPARKRLLALEDAAERLGGGDLAARAPETGGDEIATVSRAFNRMATELAARDEALRTSDALRRRMLADVSHELKTPLTAMRGYLETLQMPELTTDDVARKGYFETVERETHRIERIVADLVDLARFENGVGSLAPRVFAIGRVFEHVVRRHERDAERRQVAICTSIDPARDQLVADPDRIEQVIDNLVGNALRHTPARGRIELGAVLLDSVATLTVVDSGVGIAPEHVPYVFDRFYKVDGARAAGPSGSGLGLSIAKVIVERHGGRIVVASEPGRTQFTITIPQDHVTSRESQVGESLPYSVSENL